MGEWIEYLINPIRSCSGVPERGIQRSEEEAKINLFDVVKPPKLFHTDLEVARPSPILFLHFHKQQLLLFNKGKYKLKR